MPLTIDAAATAAALLHARRTLSQLDVTDLDREATTLADAYAVHELVIKEIGPVGAFKVGKLADGTLMMAPIPESGVRASGAAFAADEIVQSGVELEIAFRIERELPDLAAPDFTDRLRRAVVAVPAIEVVDTRLAFHDTCHPMMKLADSQFNAGLVVGAPRQDWQALNLTTPSHKLTAGAATISEGVGTVPGGSALELLEGLVRTVGQHCGGLCVGHYVTTGALSGLHWIDNGQRVAGSIAGLGAVDVLIEA